MRFFLKVVLLAALPIGSYWLYKRWDQPTQRESQTEPAKEDEPDTTQHIIKELSTIDGVTSRVAENLVAKGVKSKEALMKLTEEELRAVKGIGPKRAAKILALK